MTLNYKQTVKLSTMLERQEDKTKTKLTTTTQPQRPKDTVRRCASATRLRSKARTDHIRSRRTVGAPQYNEHVLHGCCAHATHITLDSDPTHTTHAT